MSKQTGCLQLFFEKKGKQNKNLKKAPRKNKQPIKTEYIKASIRAKVEHPFRIIKCQFGIRKAIYRGLAKNDSKLAMLFALANVFRVDQMTRAESDKPATLLTAIELFRMLRRAARLDRMFLSSPCCLLLPTCFELTR
ncbi:MAG: hypothetical protein ACI85E_001272 [Marinomonas primoryensis]